MMALNCFIMTASGNLDYDAELEDSFLSDEAYCPDAGEAFLLQVRHEIALEPVQDDCVVRHFY